MRDLHSNIKAETILMKGRAALSLSGSATSDLLGYNGAEILVGIRGTGATLGAAKPVKIYLLHGDTSTAATGAVATADVIGVTPVAGLVKTYAAAPTGAARDFRVGYIGGKRHIRVRYTATGVATAATGANGIQMTVTVVKGLPCVAPIA
jgi:hypothetical protein